MAEDNKTTTQGSGAIPAAAQNKFESSKTHARQAAEDLKSAAGVMADDLKSAAGAMAEEYRGKAEQVWGDARDRARTLQEDSEQYVRENPTKAVFTALGIGFVLGLIFRRSRLGRMAGDTMRFRNPAGHAGLLHNLLALVNDLAGFLESRIGLFAKESKTALVQVLVLVACLAAAAVLALFGYVFLIASAIAGIAHALQTSWIWITLAAAGLHFILALVCLLIARARMKKSMFEATTAELKKDREWLKNLDTKSRSTN